MVPEGISRYASSGFQILIVLNHIGLRKFYISNISQVNAMVQLTSMEAFGYEYGVILKNSTFLFFSQLAYILIISTVYSLPGSPVLWLFLMYFVTCIFSVAYDIHFFSGSLPRSIPQHIRTCTDFAVFLCTGDFLLVGDQGKSHIARNIAHDFINKYGSFTCTIFFLASLFLANCAFLSGCRFIINIILTGFILGKALQMYLGPDRRRRMNQALSTDTLATLASRTVETSSESENDASSGSED